MILARNRQLGILLVLFSTLLWSTAGLFVRMAELDVWSIVGWRSAFSFVTLGTFMLVRNRMTSDDGNGRQFGWLGLFAGSVSVVATISYVAALQWTTVANVMIVYAALPFLATLIAFLWFRERVTKRFILAGSVAFLGVVLTVGAAVSPRDLLGIGAAFAMTAGFALQLVIARRHPAMDSTAITVLAAGGALLVALPFMPGGIPAPQQLLACALYGILTTGIAYILILMGSRLIGAAEASLLSLLDVVLGPLWVWIFYDERVGLPVLAGGAVVLTAVVWYIVYGAGETAADVAPAE
ncbi:DMT family transporter [Rhizobium alvei]|uniref:DMT family transporter n=1 Tax=Rhizobium alvei TaxID=1132659 RepID=A0ABT8YHU4_9HYPH|nr:DMT family transporter [Rhizobium alvei]MDO6963237.1 DMT family transporter [Rhizobium alvei]